jgi:hypothetical protein
MNKISSGSIIALFIRSVVIITFNSIFGDQ